MQLRIIKLRYQQMKKNKHVATWNLEGTFQSSGQQTPVGIGNWLNSKLWFAKSLFYVQLDYKLCKFYKHYLIDVVFQVFTKALFEFYEGKSSNVFW